MIDKEDIIAEYEKQLQKKDNEIERLSIELNQCMIDHNKLLDRIDKAIKYINKFDDIRAYYEYIDEDGYDEYNFDEDFKRYMLEILKGDNKE